MFKSLLLSAALIGLSSPAFANHPGEDTSAKTVKTMPQMPSETDIQDIMANMPDMNALMGDMMQMMKDPELQNAMRRTGEKLERKMESSSAMDMQENGLPDFNAGLGAMLSMISDEETMGGMMNMIIGMAESMEEHTPEPKKALE